MYVVRTFRAAAMAAAATLVVGALGTGVAEARPTKPGSVTGLAAVSSEPSIATYHLHVTWNAAGNATGYEASIARAGTTVASTKVTTTSWDVSVAGTPGQQLTVAVRGVAGHFKGKTATKSVPLTDQIAPTGTYTSTFVTDSGAATITQDSLTDDSPVAGITRTVSWGDGSAPQVWTPGDTTIHHSYPLVAARYVPTVTLRDAAGHTHDVDSTGVVILDDQAPTGSFAATPATGWAKLTQVAVTQSAIQDNWSPDADIDRIVDWGDKTSTQWTGTTPATHVYAEGGTFIPTVTATDEAGNVSTFPLSSVQVKVDSRAPVVKLTLPNKRHSVKAWRTLRGKATDAGTGVTSVSVRAVEKRGNTWYGYNAKTHRWLKATTKAKASARSTVLHRTTTAQHRWTAKLRHLRKGTLVVKVSAVDRVANRSATVTRKATLSTR